jgi:hypothetical protein
LEEQQERDEQWWALEEQLDREEQRDWEAQPAWEEEQWDREGQQAWEKEQHDRGGQWDCEAQQAWEEQQCQASEGQQDRETQSQVHEEQHVWEAQQADEQAAVWGGFLMAFYDHGLSSSDDVVLEVDPPDQPDQWHKLVGEGCVAAEGVVAAAGTRSSSSSSFAPNIAEELLPAAAGLNQQHMGEERELWACEEERQDKGVMEQQEQLEEADSGGQLQKLQQQEAALAEGAGRYEVSVCGVMGLSPGFGWVLQLWDEIHLPWVVGVIVEKGKHLGAASTQLQLQPHATRLADSSTIPQFAVGGFLLQAVMQQQLLTRLGIG